MIKDKAEYETLVAKRAELLRQIDGLQGEVDRLWAAYEDKQLEQFAYGAALQEEIDALQAQFLDAREALIDYEELARVIANHLALFDAGPKGEA